MKIWREINTKFRKSVFVSVWGFHSWSAAERSSNRKKPHQESSVFCTRLGSCFIFSCHSLFIPILDLHPFPVERIAFLRMADVLVPKSESRRSGPSVLATMWIPGPTGAFSNPSFSPFGIPQSLVEEGRWGLQSCSWVMGLVSYSRLCEYRSHQTSANGDTCKQPAALSEPCKLLNGS